MADHTPVVAVIMPCHNGAATVEEAIASVQAQTFTNWELLVVDDGSTDDTPAILARLAAADIRIRVLRNSIASGGASKARNRALGESAARYVSFLDSDDLWLPDKLAIELAAMERHGAALGCGAYDVIDGQGTVTGHVRPTPGKLTYASLLGNNPVGTLTAMLDRFLCGDVRFHSALPRSEDYYLWLTILKRGLTGVCVPETLGQYRVHGKTLSSNKFSAARNRWFVYRQLENYSLAASVLYFARYAMTGVWKSITMRRRRLAPPLSGGGSI